MAELSDITSVRVTKGNSQLSISTPATGELEVIAVPVSSPATVIEVVTPGLPGPPGPPGTGQPKFSGIGPPGTIIGATPGDEYLDTSTGDLYRLT